MANNSTKSGPPPSNEEAGNGSGSLKFIPVDTLVCVDPSDGSVTVKYVAGENGVKPIHLATGSLELPIHNKAPLPEKRIYLVKEIAKILKMRCKMVRKLIREGHLEALAGSRHYRITQEALDRYCAKIGCPNPYTQPERKADNVSSAAEKSGSDPKPAHRRSTKAVTSSSKSQKDEPQNLIDEMKSWD